jgi:hypothetical protein
MRRFKYTDRSDPEPGVDARKRCPRATFVGQPHIPGQRAHRVSKAFPLYLFCPIGVETKAGFARFPLTASIESLETRLAPEPFADLNHHFENTGGTPMILFARPQRHARRQAQRIIGVPPVFPIPTKGVHRRPENHNIASPPSTDTGTGHRHFLPGTSLVVQASQDLCNLTWSFWTFPLCERSSVPISVHRVKTNALAAQAEL